MKAPTLLIVGSLDTEVLELNRRAAGQAALRARTVEVVPGAGHLFEERGTLQVVSRLAGKWFEAHIAGPSPRRGTGGGGLRMAATPARPLIGARRRRGDPARCPRADGRLARA